MRILILGGDGMLGHQLLLSWQTRHEVRVTLRRDENDYASFGLFNSQNSYFGTDVRSFDRLAEIFADFQPQAVVNAIGIIKQRAEAKDAIPSLEINALLPHRIALLAKLCRARVVHLGTDCVFSGHRGNYHEADFADCADLYGRSKLLGELHEPHCLTLRTSIIGLELARKKSLIEWFLAQRGAVRGFTRAIYSGFTTTEMARIIEKTLTQHANLHGLWHVASAPINKHDLLCQLSALLGRDDVQITPDDDFACDRSLNGQRFNEATGYIPPAWSTMLAELAQQIKERPTC